MPILGASTPGSFGNLSPTFAPTALFGCVQWLRADAQNVALNSGNVATWLDQSGNGNSATQVTAGLQPLWVSSNSVLKQPTIRFTSGTVLDHPLSAVVNNVTIWAVVASVTLSAPNFRCLYGTSGGVMLCSNGAGTGDWGTYVNGYADAGYSVVDGFGHAIAWYCSTPSTTQNFYTLNQATTSGGAGAYNGAAGVIGAGNGSGGQPLGGDVAEIAVWFRQLAASEVAQLSQYAAGRYGILTP